MRLVLEDEGGYSLVELITVMAILGLVIGAITSLFTAGINADADQNRRFQAQQEARLALNKMRRELHAACTISAPASDNTWLSSVTAYFPADSCAAGPSSITWCTVASGSQWALDRVVGTSCTGSLVKWADNLTSANVFVYLPPNSHVTSLGGGSAGIVTVDGSSSLPRLHVDLTTTLDPAKVDAYHVADDIAFRNGPRACQTGVTTC